MHRLNFFDLLFDEPGQALVGLLHQRSSAALLLVAAGVLGTFGAGLAAHAYLRGKSTRLSWSSVAANIGGLAWLLPVAAVFALYGFWMRPSLYNGGDNPSPAKTVTANDTQSPAVETGTVLPDWVRNKEVVQGDLRLVVATGEIGGTVEEATTAAHTAAVNLALKDFSSAYPQIAGWQPPAQAVSSAAIRRTFVEPVDRKTLSSGTPIRVYQGYDLVELSPSVRQALFPLWRDQVVDRRIWALGGLAGLLTLTFATLAAYFRLDERTAGLYRRRLKLAAVSVIAAGGLAAVTLL
jgi:hypothetical protein